jgi:hypothetical protein
MLAAALAQVSSHIVGGDGGKKSVLRIVVEGLHMGRLCPVVEHSHEDQLDIAYVIIVMPDVT